MFLTTDHSLLNNFYKLTLKMTLQPAVMSAKLDNPELQRKIGCMNGIFQLFDRHQSYAGRRRHTHKRLPASGKKNANYNPKCKSTTGEDKEEAVFLKQRNHHRTSFESPRTSFSSSLSSSTFSSIDNNRTTQPEPTTADFRGVVKDSIYKEQKGLSVKTTRDANQTIKYADSPRPNERESYQSTLQSKYAPRFSYDGRESRDSWTSTMKLKELPRLSLDSKQSMKHVENEGIHYRSSSVVAKLMGLEGSPNSVSSDIDYRQDENLDTTSRLLKSKYNQLSITTSTSQPASPHLRTNNPFVAITTSPSPRKPAFTKLEASTRSRSSPPSIYGEIEKRLTDLEFKSSGKDLRALKQILEAMEKTRERLEVKNEELASILEHQNRKDCTNCGNPDQSTSLSSAMSHSQHNSYPASPTSKRNVESSSIVVMKPDKFSERRISASSAMPISNNASSGLHKLRNNDVSGGVRGRKNISVDKIQATRENHLIRQKQPPLQNGNSIVKSTSTKTIHSLKLPQPLPLSPRLLQQKKYHNNQPNEQSSSPGRNIKLKSSSSKKGDKAATTTTRNQHGDTSSVQSDSIVSQTDSEVRSTGNSEDITEKLRKDATEFTTIEQPSPVSVLDATFYREGSPSPVRKISNVFTDDETQNSEETEWSTVELDHLFNEEKLKSINQLVRKLKELSSTSDETEEGSYIPHNPDDQNPDHSYITQIILASGLLFSTAMHLKPRSDQLLNPSLFHVLEQTNQSKISDKTHRKLIFDVVNEILVQKMMSASEFESVEKVGQKRQSGEKLVKEVCCEVDLLVGNKAGCSSRLRDEDDEEYLISVLSEEMMMHKSGNWIDYRSEFAGLALDIERLIFKDLVTEVVVQGSSTTRVNVNNLFSH